MQALLCRHIQSNGIQCHAVALSSSVFCYFHRKLNEGHRLYRTTMVGKKNLLDRGHIIAIPPLEDALSVQLALSEVINALACNFIDSKRAYALLYGLQISATKAGRLGAFLQQPKEVVRNCSPAPDILDNVSVDIAPAGRTVEIPDPETHLDLAGDPDPIQNQPHRSPRTTTTRTHTATPTRQRRPPQRQQNAGGTMGNRRQNLDPLQRSSGNRQRTRHHAQPGTAKVHWRSKNIHRAPHNDHRPHHH